MCTKRLCGIIWTITPFLKIVTRCGFLGAEKLTTILLSCNPGALVTAVSSTTSAAAFDHIPLNSASDNPISFHEIDKGGTFSTSPPHALEELEGINAREFRGNDTGELRDGDAELEGEIEGGDTELEGGDPELEGELEGGDVELEGSDGELNGGGSKQILCIRLIALSLYALLCLTHICGFSF